MIGVNLWGLIPNSRQDLPGLLRELKKIGFDSVESMLVPRKKDPYAKGAVSTETNFGAFFREARKQGLDVKSVHVFYKVGKKMLPKSSVIRSIRTLSREYGVESFVFSGAFTDAKGARKWAAYLNDLAEALEGENCRIVYHNHDQELQAVTVKGQTMTALDYFFSLVSKRILLQLDIGWAGMGADEIQMARKYADRIHSIHLKDFVPGTRGNYHNPNVPKERFSPIGEGEIRTAEILAMVDSFPNFGGQILVDQDFSAGDMLQDLHNGYRNVKTMLQNGK